LADPRCEPVRSLADLTAWLPPGCALWRSVGGPLSESQELSELRVIEYRLRLLAWLQTKDGSAGKNRPDPPKPPKLAREREATVSSIGRKAEAYRRRRSSTD
jgi:hypothetical protein